MITQRVAAAAVASAAVACRFASSTAGKDALPSFTRALFNGKFVSDSIHPFPKAITGENVESMKMLVEPVSKFFKEVNNAAKNDDTGEVPANVANGLKELGAFGLQVPAQYGGLELNNSEYARLVEIVGAHDLGVGIFLGAHQSIGYKGILLYGNEAQKAKYLPSLASGEHIAAFSLTEPGAGSDAAGVKTRAVLSPDGKYWTLNGAKIWISNGGIAQIFTVFAKTEYTDPVTGEKKDKMSAFVVERGFGGVTSGPPEKKMGIKCSNTAEVYFENTRIPAENILGKPGDGFKIAMGILNNGRFGMGAALSGTMKSLIQGVTEHAATRTQFGQKLRDFEVIRGKIATMAARAYAAESMAYMLAANMDRGMTDYQLEAAISKIYASEAAWYCADEAIQIMGGLGFMKAMPYERVLRDLRIFRIFEGTNDILRQMVGLTGMQSLGASMKPLQAAMKAPLFNVPTLYPVLVKHAKARLGYFDQVDLAWIPQQLQPARRVLENSVGPFAINTTEYLMRNAKTVIQQQHVAERVADAVIDLTVTAAAVARASAAVASNSPSAEHECALANLIAEEAKHRINSNVKAIAGGHKSMIKLRNSVAEHIFGAGGYDAPHPTGI